MSMDFGFDVISAEEYDRQRALYGPLTESLRRLIDAGLHTEVDEDTVREAREAIHAVTEKLESKRRSVTSAPRMRGRRDGCTAASAHWCSTTSSARRTAMR